MKIDSYVLHNYTHKIKSRTHEAKIVASGKTYASLRHKGETGEI